MLSTNPNGEPEPEPGYVCVDWGPEFLYEQRMFSEFLAGSPSDREYRLTGTTMHVGKWRIRLFPEADRAASP